MNSTAFFTKKKNECAVLLLFIIFFVFTFPVGGKAQTWYSQNGGTVTQSNMVYYTTLTDTVGVFVYNSGNYTLTNSHIWKTGNTSNTDSSSFYGRDAAVLAKMGSITLTGDSITADGIGTNGAFVCYAGASLVLTDDTISASGDYSHGIEATVGASLTTRNCIITTYGGIGASGIATDCGGGIISVFGGTVSTQELQATGIYSTGTVTDSGTVFTSAGDNGFVIDGRNTISLTNTTSSAALNTLKIYESAPGDTASGTAQFTIDGGSYTSIGHTVYIAGNYGTRAAVVIKNGAILSPGTGYIVYTDSGASLSFTADAETMTGNLFADSTATAVDTLSTALQNNTTLNGIITRSALNIDTTSKWVLTGTSYITTLTDAGVNTSSLVVSNITGNGYNVYYQPSLPGNSWLDSKNYSLVGGGCLLPEGATCVEAGINTITAAEKISIFPNPAIGLLMITYPEAYQNAAIQIMSVEGTEVFRSILQLGNTTGIDVSGLPSGFYILNVITDNGRTALKFIKY